MVRVVGSHHWVSSGQIRPFIYPHLKKHRRDLRGVVNETNQEMMSIDQPDYNTRTNENMTNVPNLELLGRVVIDADSAQKAVGALRYCTNENDTNCNREEDNGSDGEVMRDTYAVRMCDNDHEVPSFSLLDHDRSRHDSGDTGDSDWPELTQLSENCADPKERRRQRNKLSARAYRDRKRTLAQEQDQILTTLEAEQMFLREKVRKLQEEKREFLEYLKSERNIDIPNEDSDENQHALNCISSPVSDYRSMDTIPVSDSQTSTPLEHLLL